MIAATNIVSAIDAKGSPTTSTNIEYTMITNPIKANRPKYIDLIAKNDRFLFSSCFYDKF